MYAYIRSAFLEQRGGGVNTGVNLLVNSLTFRSELVPE